MRNYKNDEWISGTGVIGGRPASIRKNVSLSTVRKTDYPCLLLVSLIYLKKGLDGLPASSEELYRLNDIEEQIADHFCEHYRALLAMCITSDGTRDIFLFLPKAPSEEQLEIEFSNFVLAMDYDFALRQDPLWQPYQFTNIQVDEPEKPTSSVQKKAWWKRMLGQ